MIDQHEKRWYAVLTGSRKEKFVVDLLQRKGITSYLPLVKRTRRYASRVKTHEVPLISCYVFVQIADDERVAVLETEYVYRYIQFSNKMSVIPDDEIEVMMHVVGEYDDVDLADERQFGQGDRVELIAGELTGLKGTVLEGRGSKRYLVRLESLDLNLTWTIKSSQLKKASK